MNRHMLAVGEQRPFGRDHAARVRDLGAERSLSDPEVISLDPSFNKQELNTNIERLATGVRWCEGAGLFRRRSCLAWSEIRNNRLRRWDEVTGAVSVYREPSNHANGMA